MKTFDNILLLGRPASGKSEFIDCLKSVSVEDRKKKFSIGKFDEMDDFPWLWEKFLEDNIWEEVGFDRMYSHVDDGNYGLNAEAAKLFDFAMAKFNREIKKDYIDHPEFYYDGTLFVEFSRGAFGGYKKALSMLSKDVMSRSVILYVKVSFEESWRKNLARYEEKKKSSILAHMATRRVMETFYMEDDWEGLAGNGDHGFIKTGGVTVPFVSVINEPEIKDPKMLSQRYETSLQMLASLYEGKF